MIPKYLLPYYFKFIGLGFFTLAFIGQWLAGYSYFLLFLIIAFFGLFLIASAKEKVEDEWVEHIRLRGLQSAVFFQVIFILVFSLADKFYVNGLANLPIPAIFAGMFFILVYLGVFYYQLYRENHDQ
jgi:TRAP-type C4-dicarboxylate transport system permease small subunit